MLNNTNKVIPVFFATDDNYVPFLAVSLTSMLENASKDYNYKVYVLTTKLSETNKDIVKKVVAKYQDKIDTSVEFVSLKEELNKIQSMFHLRDYYSKETYYRFFIPNLFPQYDKVLYLDCDIVILDDISKLYNTDLGDNLVAASPEEVMTEVDIFGTYVEKALGCRRETYFNAGILLMNAKLFRLENIADQFVDMLKQFTFRVTQDEDYLNVLCNHRAVILDLGWNKTAFYNEKFDDKDLKLVHYKIAWKPWHYEGIQYEEYFWNYAKMTNMYDKFIKMRDSYSEEQKKVDKVAYLRLEKMAIEDTEDPNNYYNTISRYTITDLISKTVSKISRFLNVKKFLTWIGEKAGYDSEIKRQA